MPNLMLRKIPRYECLLEASKLHRELNPDACEAFLHVLHAGDEIVRLFGDFFHKRGLSQGRFAILMLLGNKVEEIGMPSTPAELAELSGCTRATMTGLIDTLEKDGLVRREPDTKDRRVMRVLLTENGQKMLERVLPEHFNQITDLMSALTDAEQKNLVRLMDKLLDHIGSKAPTLLAGNVAGELE